jgi:hypothetical protein
MPTMPTTMSNSPERFVSKQTTADMVLQKLLDTLKGTHPSQQTPTQSQTSNSINKTAQGIMQHLTGQKSTNPSTSYAKGMTGGNQK